LAFAVVSRFGPVQETPEPGNQGHNGEVATRDAERGWQGASAMAGVGGPGRRNGEAAIARTGLPC